MNRSRENGSARAILRTKNGMIGSEGQNREVKSNSIEIRF